MKTCWLKILAALLVVLLAISYLHNSEKEKILARLEEIRRLSEINESENGITQVRKAQQISQHFNIPGYFDLTHAGLRLYEIENQQVLIKQILRGRAAFSMLRADLQNPLVSVDENTARVEITATATGSTRNQDDAFIEIHRVEILLVKPQEDWLISTVRHLYNEAQPANSSSQD